jgi:hypothetical protein
VWQEEETKLKIKLDNIIQMEIKDLDSATIVGQTLDSPSTHSPMNPPTGRLNKQPRRISELTVAMLN